METKWKIIPVDVGTLTVDKSEFTYMRNQGIKMYVPSIIWFVTNGERQIIVDTGAPDADWSTTYHFPLTRSPEQEPEFALREAGCDPDQVDLVILTHLHWDHAFNNHLFKNAQFVVQSRELRYAIDPLPVHMKGYESVAIGMSPDYITKTKYTIIHGDKNLADGIFVFTTPGHSPGFMSVAVETEEGTYVIASDTVPLYENWFNPVPHIPHLPNAIHWDLEEYFHSLNRIEEIADYVLPGHDPKIFEHKVYPPEKGKNN